jgi:hypothetical protein
MVVTWAHEAASKSDLHASPDTVAGLMAKHDLLDLGKAPDDIREMLDFARQWKDPQRSSLLGRVLGRKDLDPRDQETEFLRLAGVVSAHYTNTWPAAQ